MQIVCGHMYIHHHYHSSCASACLCYIAYIIIHRLHRTNIRHIHYTVHTVPSLWLIRKHRRTISFKKTPFNNRPLCLLFRFYISFKALFFLHFFTFYISYRFFSLKILQHFHGGTVALNGSDDISLKTLSLRHTAVDLYGILFSI